MISSFLITLRRGTTSRYLTMSNKYGQSRVLCFENKVEAEKCKNYAVYHKTKYGYWPLFDMTNEKSILKYKNEKISNMQEIYPLIEILEIDNDTFHSFLSKPCIDFLFCHEFDYNIKDNSQLDITFTGEEILNICTSFDQIKHLNNSFNNN